MECNEFGVTPPFVTTSFNNPVRNLTGLVVKGFEVIKLSKKKAKDENFKHRSPLWKCKNLNNNSIEHIPARYIVRWWRSENEG